MDTLGNAVKGIAWKTGEEVEQLKRLNGVHLKGPAAGRPKIVSDVDATEVVLMLAPETNGEVAVRTWDALGKATGRDTPISPPPKEDEKIRFRTSSPSRARSSRRRPGPVSRARRSATTPATRTSTN